MRRQHPGRSPLVLVAAVLCGAAIKTHALEQVGRRGGSAFIPSLGNQAFRSAGSHLGLGGGWAGGLVGANSLLSREYADRRVGAPKFRRGALGARASMPPKEGGGGEKGEGVEKCGLPGDGESRAERGSGMPEAMDRRRMIASTLALSGSLAALVAADQRPANAQTMWTRTDGPQAVKKALKKADQTYNDRFVTYFSYFMLTYDRNSVNWWRNGPQTSELALRQVPSEEKYQKRLDQFASFAASAEVGLSRYTGKEGIQALCELMVNRYGPISREALKQIAILFALLEQDQPVEIISDFLPRADNSSLSNVVVTNRGSGYTGATPKVMFMTKDYEPNQIAEARVDLRANGKIARIDILDGGTGYTQPPKIRFNRTVALDAASLSNNNLFLDEDQYGTKLAKPEYEVIVENGTVKRVNIKSPGAGLFDGTFNWYFEAPSVEDVQNITGALQSDAIERRRATGSIVYDKEVCRVQIVNPGGGYSPAYPVDVRIQTPAECGGIASRQGATANADLVKPDFRSSPKPSLYEQELLKFDRSFDSRISRMDEDILALIPSSQILSYDPKQTRINFQERSAIGFNVTTRFGPRGKVPIIKDDVIGWNEFSRIAAAGAVCASIGHGALVPLDTIKLKLQTAPAGKYSNIVDASVKILRDEGGIKTFINGFQPEVLGSAVYGFISFGGTEIFRRTAPQLVGQVWALQHPVAILVFSSCFASIIAATISCPFQAVKVRMVADEEYGPGGNMIGGFQRIIREDGAYALIQGVFPYIFKDVTFVVSKFAVFDVVSKAIYFNYPELSNDISQTLLVSLVSGIVAGMCAAVTSQPGDYLFAKANEKQGATVLTAWNNYIAEGKYGAVLNGLVPRLFYGGALIALQFVIYDYCRVLFHVSPGELNVFLDVVANLQQN